MELWNYRSFNDYDFIKLCNEHDLIVIGGDNFFELEWEYSYTERTVNIKEETLNKIQTPILFHGLGCDVAKGSSETAIERFRVFLNKITSESKFLVSVRNDGSMETIRKLYGDFFNDKNFSVPDGAFFIESEKVDFPELSNKFSSIGINIATDMKEIRFDDSVSNSITYDEFIEKYSNLLNKFLENNPDYQIVLFPHIYSDLKAVYELLEGINDRYDVQEVVIAPCLTGDGSEKYIFGLYKECKIIMGMRFHANVCAIAQNIPTIGLSSYRKIYDLYNEIGLKDRVVRINELDNEDEIIMLYKQINDKLYLESNVFYNAVEKWFNR